MASIVCPSCTLPVPLDDVDLATKLAKCRRCESVFDFGAQVRSSQEEARRRRELVPPAGYRLVTGAPPDASRAGYRDAAEARGATIIERRWWTWRSLFPSILLAVIGAWSLGIGVAILAAPRRDVGELAMALVCATPGMLAFATLVTRVLNRTRIFIDDSGVWVRSGPVPVPWLGRGLDGVRPRTLHVTARRVTIAPSDVPVVYDVVAETASDPRYVLVAGLPNEEGARFVARVVADRLGLPDPD